MSLLKSMKLQRGTALVFVWLFLFSSIFSSLPQMIFAETNNQVAEDKTFRIYYEHSKDSDETLYLWHWGDTIEPENEYPHGEVFEQSEDTTFTHYADVKLKDNAKQIEFLIASEKKDENNQPIKYVQDTQVNILSPEMDHVFVSTDGEIHLTKPGPSVPDETEGIEDISVTGEVSRRFHYNEHAILDLVITNNSELDIASIRADVQALGIDQPLEIDPELKAVTLSVSRETKPGEKVIPVTVTDESGGTYKTDVTATIVEKNTDERDWDESIIYFMLTDRFNDGDLTNNNPYNLNYEAADNPRGTYQGGDFKGVMEKLAYLDELGINTIWITPIVENVGHDVEAKSENGSYYGYHGYWAKDFETLNPHLGTMEDFHQLIDEAAKRDIDIMVDVVLNHAGYGMNRVLDGTVPEGHPTKEDIARFDGMLRESAGSGDLEMSLSGLPDFKTEEQAVREQLVAWQSAWIEKSTTPNGNKIAAYRVDTVKHVEQATWQHFKNELVRKDPSFKLIGEHWGANFNEDGGHFYDGTMDSLLDFGFKTLAQSLANGNVERANEQLVLRNEALNGVHTLGQFLGSHDEDGFLYTLGGDEAKYKVAVSTQLTAKGQPVIYYGEELGQTGANNWPVYDNRYDFDWDAVENNDILTHYKILLEFREQFNQVLSKGTRETMIADDDLNQLVVKRTYEDEAVYLAFNPSANTQEISLQASGKDVTVTDHYSGEVYETTTSNDKYIVTINVPAAKDGGTALLQVEGGDLLKVEVTEDVPTEEVAAVGKESFFIFIVLTLLVVAGFIFGVWKVLKARQKTDR